MPDVLEPFPLTWPIGRPRTPPARRRSAAFKVGLTVARDRMLRELNLLRTKDIVVSSNMRTRLDGLPHSDAREPEDPGVAVYFKRYGTDATWRPFVIACDTYQRVRFNLRAIGATVEAMRAIERHGSGQMLEQAFQGFAALPPAFVTEPEPAWYLVLCVAPDADLATVRASYLALAEQHHPDKGGDHAKMARLNRAWEAARAAWNAR